MKRSVSITLGGFASKVLAGGMVKNAAKPSSADVEGAIRCYLKDKDSAGAAWPYPAFLRGRKPIDGVLLQLDIDDALWRSLEEEAKRQDVDAEQLLDHAVLYFVAEINAGRVTRRILEDVCDGES